MSRPFRAAWPVAAILVLGGALLMCDDESPETFPYDYERQAEQSWPEWASTQLRVGTGGLVSAEGRLQNNDWDVPRSFEWELTFRDDRPTAGAALMRAVARACEFPPAQALPSLRLTAHLAFRGTTSLVPALFQTDCSDDFQSLAPWVRYLERHPLLPEVRGSRISVQYGPSYEDGHVMVLVSSSDGTRSVARRIVRHLCGAPGRPRLSLDIRSSDRPRAVANPVLGSQRVRATECGRRR